MTSELTLHSLPLFPLDTVLFPGGLLALRVFEVRYLHMIGKCHSTGAPFGVVCLTHGGEVRRPGVHEAFCSVGTLASIMELEAPQPGLMRIRAAGTQRFRITARDQLRHGLWVADVQRLDSDRPVAIPDDLRSTAQALEKVMLSLRQREPTVLHGIPLEAPWQLDDCGWVANRWCELLPLPVDLKQRLMELDNPLVRLELVSDVLTRTGITH